MHSSPKVNEVYQLPWCKMEKVDLNLEKLSNLCRQDSRENFQVLLQNFSANLCRQFGYVAKFLTKKSFDVLKRHKSGWGGCLFSKATNTCIDLLCPHIMNDIRPKQDKVREPLFLWVGD